MVCWKTRSTPPVRRASPKRSTVRVPVVIAPTVRIGASASPRRTANPPARIAPRGTSCASAATGMRRRARLRRQPVVVLVLVPMSVLRRKRTRRANRATRRAPTTARPNRPVPSGVAAPPHRGSAKTASRVTATSPSGPEIANRAMRTAPRVISRSNARIETTSRAAKPLVSLAASPRANRQVSSAGNRAGSLTESPPIRANRRATPPTRRPAWPHRARPAQAPKARRSPAARAANPHPAKAATPHPAARAEG